MSAPLRHASAAIALFAMAAACAPTISEKDRRFAKIHYDIGVAEMSAGNMRGALFELRKASAADPQLPQTHNAIGLIYHNLGRRNEALEEYREALALKPDFSEAHNNIGILLIDLGRYDEAIAAFKVALVNIMYATPSLAEGNLGWACYKKGDIKCALQHLRNAVATNPKFCRGYEWLARIGIDTEEPKQTIDAVRRFGRYCVEDPTIRKTLPQNYIRQLDYYLGLAQLKLGLRDEARNTFEGCAGDGFEGFAKTCTEALEGLK